MSIDEQKVCCEIDDGLIIHLESETCEVCKDIPYIFPDRPAAKSSTSVMQTSVCQRCGCKLDGKTLKKVCHCKCHTDGPSTKV